MDEEHFDAATTPQSEQTQRESAPATQANALSAEEIEFLKASAHKRLNQIIAGHGVPLKDIQLKSFEAAKLNIKAAVSLKPMTKLATRTQAGKVNGPELIQNASALAPAIQKEEMRILGTPDLVEKIKDIIKTRPDKGIGLKNVQIKTPFLHKDYVSHEPCRPCAGNGKIQCNRCHGKGMETCPRCQGRGQEICGSCGGRQYIPGPNGQNVQCQRCAGTGRLSCTICNQTRQVQCSQCRATGAIQCQQCNGHALISHITRAEININASYEYDRAHLPDHLMRHIDALGPKVQEHVLISHEAQTQTGAYTQTQAQNQTQAEQAQSPAQEGTPPKGAIILPFRLTAPIAQITFTLPPADKASGEKPREIPVSLFGTKAALYNAPPFLETLCAPGLKHLEAAANGHGDVQAHLSKAIQYKTLRLMLVAVSKLGAKKASRAALSKIEIGLSQQGAQNMAMLAAKALSQYGRKDGLIGWAIGGGLALIFGYLYIAALRSEAMNYAANPVQGYMVDILAVLITLCLAYFTSQFFAKRAQRNGLQSLLANSKKRVAPDKPEGKSENDQ